MYKKKCVKTTDRWSVNVLGYRDRNFPVKLKQIQTNQSDTICRKKFCSKLKKIYLIYIKYIGSKIKFYKNLLALGRKILLVKNKI